jgi:hypothetical protein
VIIYEGLGTHHSYIIRKLEKMGSRRSLDSVRSKIYELKKEKAVFDRKVGKWNQVEVQALIKELERDVTSGELYIKKYEGEE